MIPLRGRLIAELIPLSGMSQGGLHLIDRKNIPVKGKVIKIGKDSESVSGKTIKPPCDVGDIIYFKKYTNMAHKSNTDGYRGGTCTLWFHDVIVVESEK